MAAFDTQRTIQILKEKGFGNYVCPCCGGKHFSVQSDIATITVTKEMKTIQLGTYIPSAVVVCTNCGNIQFFALNVLGVVRNTEEDN